MLRPALDDCYATDDRRLTHGDAIALLKDRVRSNVTMEVVPLDAAARRRVAVTIAAPHAVPAHTNAAVDGYAFSHAAYDPEAGARFTVAGRAAAGQPLVTSIDAGEAARIFTGAAMPAGTDTVAMQEDCHSGTTAGRADVVLPGGLRAGANVRRAGEDFAANSTLFDPGHALRPQDLAALASIGLAQVPCFRQLRVAVMASGNEVIAPGAAGLQGGQVFDANTAMLRTLVSTAGATATSLGIWPDDPVEITARLRAAADDFDVVITTGGASRGEEDHMSAALATLGSRHFWQLAVKPGRPMMFGQIAKRDAQSPSCVVVGLPGNPVAVFVCFLMYIYPLLQRLGGGPWPEPRRYKLPSTFAFTGRKPGRREFWRGMLVETPAGLAVDKFARDGSGLISGLRAADGLIDIPEDAGDVAVGDLVDFIPLTEFGITR